MVASRFQSFCCLFASGFFGASGFEALWSPVVSGLLVTSGLKGCLVAAGFWVQFVFRICLYSDCWLQVASKSLHVWFCRSFLGVHDAGCNVFGCMSKCLF